jgi:pimeloyl-ACP methyl ester carboxylesterase
MERMHWHRTTVQGRPASFGLVAPSHPTESTLVFLHGWALSDRTYRRSLEPLGGRGFTVLAPSLPGFRGSAELPANDRTLAAYGRWVTDFLDDRGINAPVTLVGHSFGGAVAIKTAHDHPGRVSRLVLVNAIGGATWTADGTLRTMSDRPLGDWGVHLGAELVSVRGLTHLLPVVAHDALAHAVLRPGVLWRVGALARRADLGHELEEIKRRRLPTAVLWGREDKVVPWACAESLIKALGDPEVTTVPGNHGWLISDPDRFAELLTNVLGLPEEPLAS